MESVFSRLKRAKNPNSETAWFQKWLSPFKKQALFLKHSFGMALQHAL